MGSVRRLHPVLMALALACAPLLADDSRPAAGSNPPDPGFLEFLGSVDRLAEVNPDYLSQADPAKAKPGVKPAAQLPVPASPPPSPPARPSSPPTAANATVGHNND